MAIGNTSLMLNKLSIKWKKKHKNQKVWFLCAANPAAVSQTKNLMGHT